MFASTPKIISESGFVTLITVSTTATSSVIDKSGSEMGVENVFEFNYDSIRKGVSI